MTPEETTKYGPGCYLVDQDWYKQNKEQLKVDKDSIDNLVTKNLWLANELKAVRAENLKLLAENIGDTTTIEDIEAERDELQDRNDNQKLMIEGLKREIGEHKQGRHDTKDYQQLKIQQLEQALVDATTKLVFDGYLHTENDRLTRKNNDLIDELAAQKTEYSKLEEDDNFVRHLNNDQTKQLIDLADALDAEKESNKQLRTEDDRMTEKCCGLADALAAAKKDKNDLVKTNEQLSGNLNNTLFILRQSQNDCICFKAQIESSKIELERYVADPQARDKYEWEIKKHLVTIADLKAKLANIREVAS